ncbi:hypothetical protein RUM44_003808 [Polyplax serrata]|uniref:DUF3752 domain-containing protein n=1 Tax=Polyplax serrata TaxID=468196 RepID=A0ABR1B2U3_POLSC
MTSDEEESSHSRKKFKSERTFEEHVSPSEDLCEDLNTFGPVLPPHLLQKKQEECRNQQKIYGPVLPEGIRRKEDTEAEPVASSSGKKVIGPEIPEHLRNPADEDVDEESDEEDEYEDFGPSLELMATDDPSNRYAPKVGPIKRNKESEKESVKQRESWMLELPEEMKGNLSLSTRRFKSRVVSEKERDRSVWTETPQDKLKKKHKSKEKDYNEILKAKIIDDRNKEMEKLVELSKQKYRKKEESLMEIHQRKLKEKKKKAEKEEKKPERRPFDRDVDLQIRRVDEGQRRAMLNKAMYLNSKFASGESKFL